MIQSIVFDFGDIFINLDKQATLNALQKLGLQEWNATLDELNEQFERGEISRNTFLARIATATSRCNSGANIGGMECCFIGFSATPLDLFTRAV